MDDLPTRTSLATGLFLQTLTANQRWKLTLSPHLCADCPYDVGLHETFTAQEQVLMKPAYWHEEKQSGTGSLENSLGPQCSHGLQWNSHLGYRQHGPRLLSLGSGAWKGGSFLEDSLKYISMMEIFFSICLAVGNMQCRNWTPFSFLLCSPPLQWNDKN